VSIDDGDIDDGDRGAVEEMDAISLGHSHCHFLVDIGVIPRASTVFRSLLMYTENTFCAEQHILYRDSHIFDLGRIPRICDLGRIPRESTAFSSRRKARISFSSCQRGLIS